MSEKTDLPRTWRPFGARMAGTVSGIMLVILVGVVWFAFGPQLRSKFTPLQIGTLVFLGLIALGVWLALMRSRVTADRAGLTIVNGFRRRDYEWPQVVSVSLRRGAPWATADLSDGETVSMLGIQGSDGPRAATAVRELRVIIAANSAPGA